jgi:hypothetical protein
VVPAAATFCADRLLTWIALGASIALARLFQAYLEQREVLSQSALRALLLPPMMLAMMTSKAVIDPVFLPSRARGNMVVRDNLDRAEATVPSAPWVRDERVVYLSPLAVPMAAYVAIEREGMGVPRPGAQALLSTAEAAVKVIRVDARTLRVQQRGGFLQSTGSQLLRNPERPFRLGQRMDLGFVQIEVIELCADGRPETILARFDRPLEDPSFVWLQWGVTGFVPFRPPPLGQTVTLPPADFVRAVFGDTVRLPIDGRMPPPKDPLYAE